MGDELKGLVKASKQVLYEKGIKLNLSGNEVYYTVRSLLIILKNLCSEVHCQKKKLIFFSCKVDASPQELRFHNSRTFD